MNLIEIRPDPNLISNHTIMEDLLLDCHGCSSERVQEAAYGYV